MFRRSTAYAEVSLACSWPLKGMEEKTRPGHTRAIWGANCQTTCVKFIYFRYYQVFHCFRVIWVLQHWIHNNLVPHTRYNYEFVEFFYLFLSFWGDNFLINKKIMAARTKKHDSFSYSAWAASDIAEQVAERYRRPKHSAYDAYFPSMFFFIT